MPRQIFLIANEKKIIIINFDLGFLSIRRLRPRKLVYSHCEIDLDWNFTLTIQLLSIMMRWSYRNCLYMWSGDVSHANQRILTEEHRPKRRRKKKIQHNTTNANEQKEKTPPPCYCILFDEVFLCSMSVSCEYSTNVRVHASIHIYMPLVYMVAWMSKRNIVSWREHETIVF